jgi:hypothetical protein
MAKRVCAIENLRYWQKNALYNRCAPTSPPYPPYKAAVRLIAQMGIKRTAESGFRGATN